MNAQDLKNGILQLAIQGKLVEQKEEEGTVNELLEQVKIEKEQLIKEGKIKKGKKIPEISEDEIPFEIPDGWKWRRLGDVLEIARGGSPRPIKSFLTDSDDGINWIKIGDTDKGGKYINQTDEKIIKEGLKKSRYVRKGDFLLSNSMSFGRPYILNIDGCIHDGWLVLSQFIEIFNKEFLYYLLSSRMVFNQFSSIVSGAVVNNLNSDKVRLTLVPIPPLEEQKRIVAKIEELMPFIEKYDKAYSEVMELNKKFPEDMQKSILQYAIQGKLIEQRQEDGTAGELYQQIQEEKEKLMEEGKIKKMKALPEITEDEMPFNIPDSWKWVRFSDVIDVRDGTHDTPKYVLEGIPLVTSKNLKKGEIDFENVKFIAHEDAEKINQRSRVDNGDILFAMIGSIGNPVLVNKFREFSIKNMALFKPINSELLNMEYLFWFLQLEQDFMKKKAAGGVQSFVSLTFLRNYLIPLPPVNEQKRIVKKIKELLPYAKQLVK